MVKKEYCCYELAPWSYCAVKGNELVGLLRRHRQHSDPEYGCIQSHIYAVQQQLLHQWCTNIFPVNLAIKSSNKNNRRKTNQRTVETETKIEP